MGATALRNPVTHAGKEKTPTHIRECEQEQTSSSERIDSPDCRPCEEEVDSAKAEGSQKSADIVSSGLDEDRG